MVDNKYEIHPTLFALSKDVFDKKLEIIKFAPNIHLDFMDGTMTKDASVSLEDMDGIKNYPNSKYELHLMCVDPQRYMSQIKKLGLDQVFIHVEISKPLSSLLDIVDEFNKEGIEVGAVVNPCTSVSSLLTLVERINKVMFMSVVPGAEGQLFEGSTYDKIKTFRKFNSNLPIYVDGGINIDNAKKIVNAGANVLCVGSSVSSIDDPEKSYEELCSL